MEVLSSRTSGMTEVKDIMTTPYDHEFFAAQRDGSRRSATHVVPLVIDAIQPGSVVDVGCGLGTWLDIFKRQGISDLLGLDGDYVSREQLVIDSHYFRDCDLTKPTKLERSFDLAISLEVAEHLPQTSADRFIEFLTSLAPVVVFSAAIPGQGGTGHVNEQWQDWWAEKFAVHGYQAFDLVRPAVWQNREVEWHYAQNTLVYATTGAVERLPVLAHCKLRTAMPIRLVHPRGYKGLWESTHPDNVGVRAVASQFVRSIGRAIRRRRGRLQDSLRSMPY